MSDKFRYVEGEDDELDEVGGFEKIRRKDRPVKRTDDQKTKGKPKFKNHRNETPEDMW